jgi:hypothetical protein
VRCDPGYLSYRLWIPYHLKYISQGNHMQSPNHPVSNFGLRGTTKLISSLNEIRGMVPSSASSLVEAAKVPQARPITVSRRATRACGPEND